MVLKLKAMLLFISYRHSPETRTWLETNAPWASNVVAIMYQENETYWDFTSRQAFKIYTSISDFMFGKVMSSNSGTQFQVQILNS